MKIRRFFASDTRKALHQVRRELGSDAIIISNRQTAEGVEIIAALDEHDELRQNGELEANIEAAIRRRETDAVQQAPSEPLYGSADAFAGIYQAAAARQDGPLPGAARSQPEPDDLPLYSRPSDTPRQKFGAAPEFSADQAARPQTPPNPQTQQPRPEPSPSAAAPTSTQGNRAGKDSPSADPTLDSVRAEIHQLRGMLENQFNTLQAREWAAYSPNRSKLLRHLTRLGLNRGLASQVISALGNVDALDIKTATRRALELLVQHIASTNDDILREGGQVVLLGPAGAGKTTTIAKLTAQFLQRHTARDIMFVSTDHKRIGAHEQLLTFARLFNIPILWAKRPEEIQQILTVTGDKRLILVDTPSMGAEDIADPRRLPTLWMNLPKLRNYLVLPAHMQPYTLDRVVGAFTGTPMKGCILSKVDEANTLGGALSAVIRHRLPVAYWCDGPRVTEDIHAATPQHLVAKAVAYAKLHDPEALERAQGPFLPRADQMAFPLIAQQ